jgi:hypothetical protein
MAIAAPSGLPSERSVEDVLAGRLRLTLAGQVWVLPVLTVGENEAWMAGLDKRFNPILADVDESDLVAMLAALQGLDVDLMAFLLDYDKSGVLPRDETFRKSIYPHELFKAVAEVGLAANPTAAFGLAAAVEITRAQGGRTREAMAAVPSRPTSSSPKRTAGRSRKSSKG